MTQFKAVSVDLLNQVINTLHGLDPNRFSVEAELRAVLETPDLQAGADMNMAELGLPLAVLHEAFTSIDSAERVANMNVAYTVAKAFGEFQRIRIQVSELHSHAAELKHQRDFWFKNHTDELALRTQAETERNALQGELTELRELLRDLSSAMGSTEGRRSIRARVKQLSPLSSGPAHIDHEIPASRSEQ